MAKDINYKKLFSVQKDIERRLRLYCPDIDHKSGIYFLIRHDEEGGHAYIGKSVDVLNRMVSHTQSKQQRIDGSLKKRGYYTEDNKLGWKLGVIYFPEEELDGKEQFYIEKYKSAGYEMYNIESGGTNGKEIIGDRQAPKGYRDGIEQGKKSLRRELNKIINKYLIISLKVDNKLSHKMLEKFWKLLEKSSEDDK